VVPHQESCNKPKFRLFHNTNVKELWEAISQRTCSVLDMPTKESTPAKEIPGVHLSVKSELQLGKMFGIYGESFHGALIVPHQDIMVSTPALRTWDHGSQPP